MLATKKKLIRITDDPDAFKSTINTALGTGASIDFRTFLPDGQNYDFVAQTGDGGFVSYTGTTPSTDPSLLYNYSGGHGVYQLSFSGKVGGFSVNNGIERLKFTSVDQWGGVGFDYLSNMFNGCSNLSSLAVGGIKYQGNSLFQSFFFTSITSLPQDLLDGCVNLTNLQNTFFGTDITSIPLGFLDYVSTTLTSVNGTWTSCLSLTSLPEDLFYQCASITNYANTFSNCRNLVLPTRMFNLAYLSSVVNFLNFMSTNSTSFSNTGTIQDVWNYATSATSTNAFVNQTGLTNYASIPFEWKGMVEVGTLTTDQSTLQQVGITRTYSGIAEINWGDGSFARTTSGVEATKDYVGTGTYDIKLGADSVTATTYMDCDSCNLTAVTGLKGSGTLRLQNNDISGTLDISNWLLSGILRVDGNASLTGFTFAPSGNGTLSILYFQNCNITGSIDLATPDIKISNDVYGYNNAAFTGFAFATSGNSTIDNFRMYNCNIAAIDFSNVPIGNSAIFLLYSNPIASIIFAATGNGAILQAYLDSCQLPNIDFSVFATSTPNIRLQNNSFTATEHDNQLINLDATGWVNGILNILTGNTARTSASDTAYNNLITKGWTIL